jgi:hypothetical protein
MLEFAVEFDFTRILTRENENINNVYCLVFRILGRNFITENEFVLKMH